MLLLLLLLLLPVLLLLDGDGNAVWSRWAPRTCPVGLSTAIGRNLRCGPVPSTLTLEPTPTGQVSRAGARRAPRRKRKRTSASVLESSTLPRARAGQRGARMGPRGAALRNATARHAPRRAAVDPRRAAPRRHSVTMRDAFAVRPACARG